MTIRTLVLPCLALAFLHAEAPLARLHCGGGMRERLPEQRRIAIEVAQVGLERV